ncbi:copper amine oxidase N-terminal domain-containing protein [Neomoorella thermoacetica]|uniref:copper amine oxidase N-terminal domain-containing protein n=1 Tax=Neomoorella thermoacetica TaxID=1525 RepID=UPI0009083ECA|nr:copper amine oxidase N-terminal domain-containing protein [Moorella thermoacetica]APC09063.1 hypothetical protein MTJW_19130 [Moorella thermoacetica]OIQ54990.1 hypothetical protein MORE_07360 [Moorella thermoacetica]
MRKKIVPVVILILALALAGAAWAANNPVRVLVDGQELHPDVPAYINSDNRTMIPYRAVSEALGATVDWKEADQSVTVRYEGKTVVMWVGKSQYTVNGVTKTMDTVPVIKNNRTMIPIRALAEGLGCEVSWVQAEWTVYVMSQKALSGTPAKEYFGNAPSWVYDSYTGTWPVRTPQSLPFTALQYGLTIYDYHVTDRTVEVRMSQYDNDSLLIKRKDGTWYQTTPDKKDYAGAYTHNADGTDTVHYPLYHLDLSCNPQDIAEMYIVTAGEYIKLP